MQSFIKLNLTLNLLNVFNGIIYLPFLELTIIIFKDIRMKTWKLICQQYKTWSECMDTQAGLALYLWQWFIISSSNRVRVKSESFKYYKE